MADSPRKRHILKMCHFSAKFIDILNGGSMRSKNKEFVGLELSPELFQKIKALAIAKELSLSAIIRLAILEYVEKRAGE